MPLYTVNVRASFGSAALKKDQKNKKERKKGTLYPVPVHTVSFLTRHPTLKTQKLKHSLTLCESARMTSLSANTGLLVGGVAVGVGMGYLLRDVLSPGPSSGASPGGGDSWPQIGFVGCGTIASAIVTGLCTLPVNTPRPEKIVVSPRNKSKSAALRTAFPSIVSIAKSNQDVVDQCDVAFLCVVPQVARKVVSHDLPKQTVISVIASLPVDEVGGLVQPVPRERMLRYSASRRIGSQRRNNYFTEPNC